MTEIIRVDGAPGVGKSTRLFEFVEEEKEGGRSLTDLYYLTFTRSGREESATKLGEVFPTADQGDLMKRAKTFHGAAWVACAINGLWEDPNEQIIQPTTDEEVFRDFCDANGLSYAGESNTLKAIRDGEEVDGAGDALFAKNDWLKLTRRPPEDHHMAPTSMALDHERVTGLLRGWEDYKLRGRPDASLPLYEHADYVDEAVRRDWAPPASVLFLDEFQDLSPQEYKLFKTWRDSGQFDRIYIAGDANQSIYSFRAGTPLYFEETPVDRTIEKKKSYRCPSEIVRAARGVLEDCKETDPKGFQAARPGGQVEEISVTAAEEVGQLVKREAADHEADGGPSVMLLTRANYQVYALSKALRNVGVPHEFLGRQSAAWDETLTELLEALRTLDRGTGGMSRKQVSSLFSHVPQAKKRKSRIGGLTGGVYQAKKVWNAFPDLNSAADVAKRLDLDRYKREMLASAVSTTAVTKPSDVKVGTIHAAKGLEAPSVLLFDAYTPQLVDAYNDDARAEEHRLYYVGVTRASETLNLVRDYFDGPNVPIFDRGIPEFNGEVVR